MKTSDRPPRSRPIVQLQLVRALAALIVVVFHAQGELRHRGLSDPFPDLTIGAFGVDLFFVVSGFIMVHASERLFGRRSVAWPFLVRRLARIAPLYWAFTAVFAGIALWFVHIPGHPQVSVTHVVASFLFLPALRPEDGSYFPVYSLGWTLNYEMFFYVCFSLTLGLRRESAVAALSAALVALVVIGRSCALPWPLFYWSDPIVLEFLYGLWLGLAHARGWRLSPRAGVPLSFAAVACAFFYVPHIDSAAAWRGFAWGVTAAVLVAAILGVEASGTSLPVAAVRRIGDASFSLYLVHSLLFIVLFQLVSHVLDPHGIPSLAYASLLVLASIASALALFNGFERPITRRLQSAMERRARVSPSV